MTVFGRDTIITCLQTLLFGPELARTALYALAALQAREDDPSRDAEPGKIVHEVRRGKAAERWFDRYYGTVDATPLFLILLSEVWQWTDDAALVTDLQEPALAALRWIDEWGDRDGDGFVEFERRAPNGLAVQSWKDSGDSQRFHDGRIAEAPIAPCEVQGYVYDAKRRVAAIAREVWRDRALADRLEREAAELRARFDEAFWVDERGGFFALALDRDKRAGRLAHLEHRPPALVGDRPPVARRRDRRPADERAALVGLGRAHDVGRRRGLQPAQLPQRHGLAPRQLPDRVGPRPRGPLARVPAHRPPAARRGRATSAGSCRRCSPACAAPRRRSRSRTRPPRARRRGPPARRCCCSSSCSGSSPTASTTSSRRARPSCRRGRATSGSPACARSTATGTCCVEKGRRPDRGRDVRIAILAPAWFPVPPTGYGGIEWVVWLLADGLVDAGHDVTLFAAGQSRTKAKLDYVYEEAPSDEIGRTLPGAAARAPLLRAAGRVRPDQRPHGPARRRGRRGAADAARAHRPRPARRDLRARCTSSSRRSRPRSG